MKKFIIITVIICSISFINNAIAFSTNEPSITNIEEPSYNESSLNEELEGWSFYINAKLYYKEGGVWKYYGTYPVYFNRADNNDDCNQWVRFSKYCFLPAEYHYNRNIELPRRVKYQGVYFYF